MWENKHAFAKILRTFLRLKRLYLQYNMKTPPLIMIKNPRNRPVTYAAAAFAALPLGVLVVVSSGTGAFSSAPPHKGSKDGSKTVSPAGHGDNSTPPALAAPRKAAHGTFAKDVTPVVQKYCVSCHSGDSPSAGISLGEYKTAQSALSARKLWQSVSDNVASKHMPPEGMPQPTPAEREKLTGWVESAITQADCDLKDPGRVTLRRLNRVEYNNTVRDLTGVSFRPADDFPSDDVGYGFDNIGDVLSISPLLMEKYLNAAGKITQAAIVSPEDRIVKHSPALFSAGKLTGAGEDFAETSGHLLASVGACGVDYDFAVPGEYQVAVTAFEQQAGPPKEHAQAKLTVGGKEIRTFAVRSRQNSPGETLSTVKIDTAGKQRVEVAFLNDYFDEKNVDEKLRGDRNLIIQSIKITPMGDAAETHVDTNLPLPASNKKLIVAYPTANTEAAKNIASQKVLRAFATRAYRRPVTAAEVDRLVRCAAFGRHNGASYEKGIQIGMQAALVSPFFLFRVETDPNPNNASAKHVLNDYELATRLSYFLWSSTPDARLTSLAAQKKLHDPKVLNAEAQRMLRDPRASALGDNFAGQWLQLRKLAVVTPDAKTFPQFNDSLRAAMREETARYFQTIVQEDRSVLEFIDSDWTWLNEPLARHYGNTSVMGNDFRIVKLQSGQRGGVLTQASVLTVTSNTTRTSPVKRGKWVLENLLGTPIPPPPPNVAQLPDDANHDGVLKGTLRQRLEAHRSNPACASCHNKMDPIGFGLENFNAIGQWRTTDGGAPVDTSGTLPSGKTFRGPKQLKGILLAQKGQFVHNLSEKMLTYALGRGMESTDRCNVDAIAQDVASHNYKFSALVSAIVTSEPFRMRRGDGGTTPTAPVKSVKVAQAPAKEAKK